MPWLGIEPTILAYQDDILINWATWPGPIFAILFILTWGHFCFSLLSERDRERETSIGCLFICTLTWDWICNLGMCRDQVGTHDLSSYWTMFQPNEPHRPGQSLLFLRLNTFPHFSHICEVLPASFNPSKVLFPSECPVYKFTCVLDQNRIQTLLYLLSVAEKDISSVNSSRGITSWPPASHFLRSDDTDFSFSCFLSSSLTIASPVSEWHFFPFSSSWALRFWFNLRSISRLL